MDRLSKNFLWMAAANIFGSIFSIILFIYLARALKAETFGMLSYAHSIVFYLLNFVDLGLTTYGIREAAKDRSRISEYVSEIVSFKLLIASALFLLFILVVSLTHQSFVFKVLLGEACLMLFVVACATEWAFQAEEKMRMVFVSFAVTTSLQLTLLYIFVKSPADILKAPLVYFAAALPIIAIFLTHFKFRPKLERTYLKNIAHYLSSSLIIWLISICAQVYNGVDIVLLGLFRSPAEVGYFAVARRTIGGATLLIVFLANAVLPRLSSTFCKDGEGFRRATRKFLKISVGLTVFGIIPAIFLSKEIIALTIGVDYLPAVLPLRIMMLGLIFVLFNLPYSTGLIATGLEKEVLKQVFASAFLSIALNITLMPYFGMAGAAVSFFFAEALALVWILIIYHYKLKPSLK